MVQRTVFSSENEWPVNDVPPEDTQEDARGVVLFHEIVKPEAVSTWKKLIRVTAMVLRFVSNCRRKHQGKPVLTVKATAKQLWFKKSNDKAIELPLQQNELEAAEKVLWKQAQWESFPDELNVLTRNQRLLPGQLPERVSKRSCIYKLSPVIDQDGVLRVDGRLANTERPCHSTIPRGVWPC